MPGNAFFGPQNDMFMGEPMLIMGPFMQQPWPGMWDSSNNMPWNSPAQSRPFGWAQQTPKQPWNSFWQWPNTNNNNNNQNPVQWPSSQQQQQPPVPVVQQQQQNPASSWQAGNQWQNGVQAGASWQSGANNLWQSGNQWPNGNGWQGQQQWPQNTQTWPGNQNSNEWSVQRVTDSEHSSTPTEASAAPVLDNIRKMIGMFLANRLAHLFQRQVWWWPCRLVACTLLHAYLHIPRSILIFGFFLWCAVTALARLTTKKIKNLHILRL